MRTLIGQGLGLGLGRQLRRPISDPVDPDLHNIRSNKRVMAYTAATMYAAAAADGAIEGFLPGEGQHLFERQIGQNGGNETELHGRAHRIVKDCGTDQNSP